MRIRLEYRGQLIGDWRGAPNVVLGRHRKALEKLREEAGLKPNENFPLKER